MKKISSPKSLILGIILITAGIFRLHKIEAYLTFLGDEGRDVLVALNIIRGDLTFLGPRASAGDFFLGPIYYYMITPFLFLFNYNPVGPAIMVALIGIATVFLVYYVSKKFFGTYSALAAASIYAISPLVVQYSRSSWNPNPMPFVSLLSLYLLYLGVKEQSWKKLVFVGLLLGVAMQLHYLATFLAVIVAVFVIAGNVIIKKTRLAEIRGIMFQFFQIFAGFIISFSPFLAFEFRHNFPNLRTIFSFIFSNTLEESYEGSASSFFDILGEISFRVFGRILTAFPPNYKLSDFTDQQILLWQIATVALGIVLIISVFKIKNRLQRALILTWLILGIALFGFYKKEIHDYYLGFMFPLPFLMFANFLHVFPNLKYVSKQKGKIIAVIIFATVAALNLINHPFKTPPNHQKDQMKRIAEFVLEKTNEKPYNFALLSSGNTDHAYRYFFELNNMPPITIENNIVDPERNTATDQLFVICEEECSPLGHDLWEIAGFGQAEIEEEWRVSVSTVYKLVPYQQVLR